MVFTLNDTALFAVTITGYYGEKKQFSSYEVYE